MTKSTDHHLICNSLIDKLNNHDGERGDTEQLCSLIDAFQATLNSLDGEWISQLIDCLSSDSVNWFDCGKGVTDRIVSLLTTLVSQFPEWTSSVCRILWELLLPHPGSVDEKLHDINMRVVKLTTKLLLSLSQVAEQIPQIFSGCMAKKFPTWRGSTQELFTVVSNVLCLLSTPSVIECLSHEIRCSVLRRIFYLITDVELYADHATIPPLTNNDAAELSFDLPTGADQSLKAVQENSMKVFTTIVGNANSYYTRLDLVTWLVSSHLRFVCASTETTEEKLDWPFLRAVFKSMRDVFSERVLPLNTTMDALPLLMFQLCSLRGGLMINFAEFLWRSVKEESRDLGSRITALAYLTYLMVRLNGCFIELTIELLNDMTAWCVDFVYRHRGLVLGTQTKFSIPETRLYYAVCDAIVYSIVQLHAVLLDSKHFYESCELLPLAQIALSPLKPWSNMPRDLFSVFNHLGVVYGLNCFALLPQLGHKDGDSDPLTIGTNVLDVECLSNLETSNCFSLPLQNNCLPATLSCTSHLFRPACVGKRFCDVDPNVFDKSSPSKRKRKLDDHASENNDHKRIRGVDVSKFSVIVTDYSDR